ncbi:hypothetical protein NDI76_05835 [Halogeometricum sp. S1BR25-6]|uniref:DUF7847 domain-containing protein n=1 Tax=Halogeometricum salsisoli TaxID=2950536 RepID=A0ABU2GBS6_9EURY|nr:hypothetical protein [Halogeometricum sp. S1BR25-6]MDS0298255.1 hypothetical protein [Halogeometricum sp. S1BR25-6]
MSALQSLRTAFGSLASSPVLFLAGLAYAVVVLPQSVLPLAGMQLAGSALQLLTFFVTPFLIAGIIGMAAEATAGGDTSLSTLTRVGKDRYVPLLIAKFVQIGVYIAYAIAAGIVALIVAAIGFVAGVPLLAGLALLLFFLGALVLQFFIQFFPVAVALDDADAIDSFRVSLRLVRENLLSTLGYTVLTFLVTAAVSLVTAGPIYYQQIQTLSQMQEMQQGGATPGFGPGGMPTGMEMFQFSTAEILLIALISLASMMLVFTFRQTYATAFYEDHVPPLGPEDPGSTTDAPGAVGADELDATADDGWNTERANETDDGWATDADDAGDRADDRFGEDRTDDHSDDRSNDRF